MLATVVAKPLLQKKENNLTQEHVISHVRGCVECMNHMKQYVTYRKISLGHQEMDNNDGQKEQVIPEKER